MLAEVSQTHPAKDQTMSENDNENESENQNYYGNTEEEIVRKFCREEKLDVERALAGLVRAMVDRHVDRKLREEGALPPFTPGNERADALVPLMDALHQRRFGDTREAKEYELLFRMLCAASMIAEQRVEKESKPKMRLVE